MMRFQIVFTARKASANAFTLVQSLIVIATLLLLAALLFPVFVRDNHPHGPSCQSQLKQIGLGLRQYVQDYDEKWPLVASNDAATGELLGFPEPAYGWADAIQPYLKSVQIYQCPDEPTPVQSQPDARSVGFTDYWMNSRLAGMSAKNVREPALTIVTGDGNDGTDATNARYSISMLPPKWRNDANSPLYRHLEGANFGFADGHVKWFRHDKMDDLQFAPR